MESVMDSVAVVGMSYRLPGGATDDSSLWETLSNGRNVMSEWPKDRANIDNLFKARGHTESSYPRGGHFLQQDPAVFDARFFNITPNDATSMDPQQRLAMEASYHAFESAGSSIARLNGSRTAVFASSMSDDYNSIVAKDPDSTSKSAVAGLANTMLPNRLSWFYGLQGPSVYVDTACSGSLVALDLACKSIRDGTSDMALVIGVNLMLGPDTSLFLNDMMFTSPDSVCWSFDHRANGYGRGEGIIALVLKPLSGALTAKDTIRAVIRGTGSNQDGRTLGVTQPSSDSQEKLIRDVYARAGLDFKSTRYVEAHGTGTPVGDPIEMEAIGRVFGPSRSTSDPLHVGSIKSNIGHLEAASGLAGVIKSILTLERGVIPPNANFETLNPNIDADRLHVNVLNKPIDWPSEGLRRLSINSFGFGGTNSHVIMDDAFHFLRDHGLLGYHNCTMSRPLLTNGHSNGNGVTNGISNGTNGHGTNGHGTNGHGTNGTHDKYDEQEEAFLEKCREISPTENLPQLLAITASSRNGLSRVVGQHEEYFKSQVEANTNVGENDGGARQLARWTNMMATRRDHLSWRSFALVQPGKTTFGAVDAIHTANNGNATTTQKKTILIFTGQGAQYSGMGLELLGFPEFARSIWTAQQTLNKLGCTWSILEELSNADNLKSPRYTQPLCTILQIALYDLLRGRLGSPVAVVGHSSGEIAAAYASGHLSREAAVQVAYWRGHVVAEGLWNPESPPTSGGAMVSVNLAANEVNDFLLEMKSIAAAGDDDNSSFPMDSVKVACVNSPSNCTLSVWPQSTALRVKEACDAKGIFASILNTGVAYHSQKMQAVAPEYLQRLREIGLDEQNDKTGLGKEHHTPLPMMLSSVTGKMIEPGTPLSSQYWVDNLISPVLFSQAVQNALEKTAATTDLGPVTEMIEIGPHPALRRPVTDIVNSHHQFTAKQKQNSPPPHYLPTLQRSRPQAHSILSLLGNLFCRGHDTVFSRGGLCYFDPADDHVRVRLGPVIPNCPKYPFDTSSRYWNESRFSRDFRLREDTPGAIVLGNRSLDWNPLEPRWRSFLSLEMMPWLGDHVVSGKVLAPGTAMMVMALEAVQATLSSQGAGRSVAGYMVNEAHFLNPLYVGETRDDATEAVTRLRSMTHSNFDKGGVRLFEVNIYSYRNDKNNNNNNNSDNSSKNNQWTQCFRAVIEADLVDDNSSTAAAAEVVNGGDKIKKMLRDGDARERYEKLGSACVEPVDSASLYTFCRRVGITFGPQFQLLRDIRCDKKQAATAVIDMASGELNNNTSSTTTTTLPHPVILDAAIHLVYAHMFINQMDPVPLIVPRHLGGGWVVPQSQFPSSSAAQKSHSIKILSIWEGEVAKPGSTVSILCIDDNGSLIFGIERLAFSTLSHQQLILRRTGSLVHRIQWQPHLSFLDRSQLRRLFPEEPYEDRGRIIKAYLEMERTMIHVIHSAMNGLSGGDGSTVAGSIPTGTSRYLQAIRHHLDHTWKSVADGRRLDNDELERSLRKCEEDLPEMAWVPFIARRLPSLVHDDSNVLEDIFSDDLADRLYSFIFSLVCDARFDRLLHLISHENPRLRILEVGAGMGGMTQRLVGSLLAREKETGCQLFTEYVYTDISASFFERAREKFSDDRFKFKVLDLDRDPGDQGFDVESYDLVVAGSCIHATSDLAVTMGNVRRLLVPGGRLINVEMVLVNSPCLNIAFGLLPGWFNSTEPWRLHSPLVSESRWDSLYQETGFSGTDFLIKDVTQEDCHTISLMVTTATSPSSSPSLASPTKTMPEIVLITDDGGSDLQKNITEGIKSTLSNVTKVSTLVHGDVEGLERISQDAVAISLLEMGVPFLGTMDEERFTMLKFILSQFRNILWAGSCCLGKKEEQDSQDFPYQGLKTGLIRSIRAEAVDKHIVTLEIRNPTTTPYPQPTSSSSSTTAIKDTIMQILTACFQNGCEELEWILEEDSFLTSGRFIEDRTVDREVSQVSTPQWREAPWLPGPPLQLEVGVPGQLNSLRFAEDLTASPPPPPPDSDLNLDLEPGEVEVEAGVMAVAFRDVFIALGRIEGEAMGTDCAGVVRRVSGRKMEEERDGVCYSDRIQVGDRVCLIYPGCLRTYPRAPAHAMAKIPNHVSMEDAVSVINPGITAFHSLIHLARLQPGESVLIHSAAGSTGQMAVHMAKMAGAEIFVTVGFGEKKELMTRQFGIPEDHVFYSRDNSFLQGIRQATKGRGVDVVLNSLSGNGFLTSWKCLAPYGRFVEIGKVEVMANSSLPMGGFARNTSFFAVDLLHMAISQPRLINSHIRTVMDLLGRGVIQAPYPLHTYRLSQVEEAFRSMQSGRSMGRILLKVDRDEIVPRFSTVPTEWQLSPDATYMIVGGFGGAARSIARWMCDRGARNLVLLSRSGASPSNPKAMALVSELQGRGVKLLAPPCDASSYEALEAVMKECTQTMPPIKGCINAAMALHDSIFSRMSFDQWQATIKSKVNTSWNLHRLLPSSDNQLDFFVMLSSITGVYGSVAQANYCAGNTFQDQLARYRRKLGLPALSLDVGWLRTIGAIAESQKLQTYRTYARDTFPIEEAEFLGVLNASCRPGGIGHVNNSENNNTSDSSSTSSSSSSSWAYEESQITLGAITPDYFLGQSEEPIELLRRPLFSGMWFSPSSSLDGLKSNGTNGAGDGEGGGKDKDEISVRVSQLVALFEQESSSSSKPKPGEEEEEEESTGLSQEEEGRGQRQQRRTELVVEALSLWISRVLSLPAEEIVPGKVLADYGVDSLLAVEIRNWILKHFGASVAVFDIMGGVTIQKVGELVQERSKFQ